MVEALPTPLVQPMIDAALKAAHIALLRRKEGVTVGIKPDGTKVTNGDLQSEQIIIDTLQKATPNIRMMGEEDKDHDFFNKAGLRYVFDPIDGTIGYSRAIGEKGEPWCISIGLEKDGKTIGAVVYEAAPNEYGNRARDRNSIDPSHPRGRIYWADAKVEGMHVLSGSASDITVRTAAPADYAQNEHDEGQGLRLLKRVPKLTVDYRGAHKRTVSAKSSLPLAPFIQVDCFVRDVIDKKFHAGALHRVINHLTQNITQQTPVDCYSGVAGALKAAEGIASGYINGNGYPWDYSAVRLLMEKSGTTFAEYEVPEAEEKRTLIVASRDPQLFDALHEMVLSFPNIAGDYIGGVNLPPGKHQITRREALSKMFTVGAASAVGFTLNKLASHAHAQTIAAMSDHLPRTYEALLALPDQDKVLLAAATASGCDAFAYYTPDGDGKFALQRHLDLYPERDTKFAAHIAGYDANTFNSNDAIRTHDSYHIPVYATNRDGTSTGQLKGILVLRAPTDDYSRVKTAGEEIVAAQNSFADAHESVSARRAKLKMAAFIVGEHQDLFGLSGQLLKQHEQAHNDLPHKLDYFKRLATAMFDTLLKKQEFSESDREAIAKATDARSLKAAMRKVVPLYDTNQTSHVLGVTDLMEISLEAVNKGQTKPVFNNTQQELVELLTMLHDVGKTQMSSSVLRPWRVPIVADAPEAQNKAATLENAERNKYFVRVNHNHPLFTLTTLLLYPQDAIDSSSHHHGFFRYTDKEMQEVLGDDYGKYRILTDNLTPDKIPPIARMMRVCDVTEAITNASDRSLDYAITDLAGKAQVEWKDKMVTPNTIDPDYLCFMIENGVFKSFGERRDREEKAMGNAKGWVDKDGKQKYDPAALEKAGQAILEQFNWKERRELASARIREAMAHDPLIEQNPGIPAPAARRAR